jgi:type IV secretion system protein TrbF
MFTNHTSLAKRRKVQNSQVDNTPYDESRMVLAQITRQSERYATGWQLGCLALAGLVVLLGVCLAYTSTRATIVPYVIEVDGLGHVRAVGPAQIEYRPKDEAIAAHIRKFIVATRGLSTDGKVMHDRWDEAFAWVTQEGARRLQVYGEERAFDAKIGKEAIAVEINRSLRQSEYSWDISWREIHTTQDGTRTDEYWSGLFTVVLKQPTTEQELQVNPLGIWLNEWSWTK